MKLAFFGDAIGQINNCVSIAQVAKMQGHTCVFMVNEVFSAFVEEQGFTVYPLKPSTSETQDYHQQVNQTLDEWDKPSIEQIENYIGPYYEMIVDGCFALNPSMIRAIDHIKPQVIIVDDVVSYPAILNSNIPWVRVVSCDETEVTDQSIPPHLSGYPLLSDKTKWQQFSQVLADRTYLTHQKLNAFLIKHGLEKLMTNQFINESKFLNVLICPKIVALPRANSLGNHFLYANGCVRKTDPYRLPPFSKDYKDKPLIYFSFGTMGTVATDYTTTLLSAFKNKPFRVIATVGEDFIKTYEYFSDNIQLYGYLPQPSIIEQSDLVIFHGGNNTNNECYFYGKPVIAIPFAWDEHAVAQRRAELGLGAYLIRKQFMPDRLPQIASQLLNDSNMDKLLKSISENMQLNPGPVQILHKILSLLDNS